MRKDDYIHFAQTVRAGRAGINLIKNKFSAWEIAFTAGLLYN